MLRRLDFNQWLALAFVLCVGLRLFQYAGTALGIDYYNFWAMSTAAPRGEGLDFYAAGPLERIGRKAYQSSQLPSATPRLKQVGQYREHLHPTASPFLFMVFGPLVSGNYDRDLRLYNDSCIVVTVLSVFFLARLAGLPLLASLVFLGMTLLAYVPLVSDIRVGNVNQIQLGLVTLFLWLCRYRRFVVAGLLLGLALLFKANIVYLPVVLVGGWLLNREFRTALLVSTGTFLGMAIGWLVSSLYFGSMAIWSSWLSAIRLFYRYEFSMDDGNHSLSILVKRLLDVEPNLVLNVVVMAVLLAITVGRARRFPSRELPVFWVTSLALAAMLVCAKVTWLHYHVLLLPLYVCSYSLVLQKAARGARVQGVVPGLGLISWLLVSLTPIEPLVDINQPLTRTVIYVVGCLLVFIPGLFSFGTRELNPVPSMSLDRAASFG